MANQSILDLAAEVREKERRVKEVTDELRHAKKDWTNYSIAAEDAVEIARNGLRGAWTMLDRIQQLAKQEKDRAP